MSAIFGIVNAEDEPVDSAVMDSMALRLRHRASRQPMVWIRHNVSLGHASLPTTPEAVREQQPLFDETSGVRLTGDVRLDNRQELAAALDMTHALAWISDSQLILLAYLKWQDRCAEHLRGDFAFAIWDPRGRQLFCARDVFGVKPFFFAETSSAFAFASEIKALQTWNPQLRGINRRHVAEFLAGMGSTEDSTCWEGIRCLAEGHCLTARQGNLSIRRFDRVDPARAEMPLDSREIPGVYRQLMTDAVRQRSRTTQGVGCFLSGGLDSSSVVAVARTLNRPIQTFSKVYSECEDCDERPYIQAVLDQGGCSPTFMEAPMRRSLDDLRDLVHEHDEPMFSFGLFSCQNMWEQPHRSGLNAVMDGHGGDETLCNTNLWLKELAAGNRWGRLALASYDHSRRTGYKYLPMMGGLLASHGVVAKIRSRLAFRTRLRNLRSTASSPAASTPAMPQWALGLDPDLVWETELPRLRAAWRSRQPQTTVFEQEGHLRSVTASMEMRALNALDCAASSVGVEPRYPFLDRSLVEFCIAAPPHAKHAGGWPRALLRDGVGKLLPKAISRRVAKTYFQSHTATAIKSVGHGVWKDFVTESTAAHSGWVSAPWLQDALDQLYERPQASGELLMPIWRSLVTLMWLRERA